MTRKRFKAILCGHLLHPITHGLRTPLPDYFSEDERKELLEIDRQSRWMDQELFEGIFDTGNLNLSHWPSGR
jgi:hypothetical protein